MVVTKRKSYARMASRALVAASSYYHNKAKPYVQIMQKAAKVMKPTAGQTQSNQHTTVMVTENDRNASLYVRKKRGRMSKVTKLRLKSKRKFKAKVKSALLSDQRLSSHCDTFSNDVQYANAITLQREKQEVWPTTTQRSLMLAFGNDLTTACGVPYVAASVNLIGMVDGATAVAVDYGKTMYFPFQQTLKFSLWTGNSEYTATNPLITDIYECVAAKDIDDVAYNSPQAAFLQCIADGQTLAGRTVLSSAQKGITPFNAPNFGNWWKIQTVTRVSLVYNTITHYKMHTRGVYKNDKFYDRYCVKGITKGIMFISEPTFQFALPAAFYNFNVSGISSQINYRVPPKFNTSGAAFTTQITLTT